MKSIFVAIDLDGKPVKHEIFDGKEFTSPSEMLQTINDYNREAKKPFKATFQIINVLTY